MKIAALEKSVPICDIFFFLLKVHRVGGTMGGGYMQKYHGDRVYEKISYAATQKREKH